MEPSFHVDQRFVATLALAWATPVAGLLLGRPSLVLLGALLGGIAFVGITVPSALATKAEQNLQAENPTEGESFRASVSATNEGRRTYLAEWKFQLPDTARIKDGQSRGLFVLPKGQPWELSFELEMLLFGLHELGPLSLRIWDPFGFMALETTVGEADDVSVYPRRGAMKQPVNDAKQKRAMIGRYEVSQPGKGFEFFGLRDYQQGDQPRDINWKASARADDLIVNQQERETNAEIVIFVDTRADTLVGQRLTSPFAEGCRTALALAETHLNARDDIRFFTYGADVERDQHTGSQRKVQEILDKMLRLEPSGDTPLSHVVNKKIPHLTPRSPVFLVSPLVGDDTIEDAIFTLQSHEFEVTALVPPPQWGPGGPVDGDAETSSRRLLWEAEQERRIRSIRGQGAVATYLDPEVPLYALLRRMEMIY